MGRIIADRYELRTVAGCGPHGVVWSGRDRMAHRDVAVKLLDPRLATDVLDRLRGTVGTPTPHPTFVRVLDVVVAGATAAVVTELVTGEDLRRRLNRSGAQPAGFAVAVGRVLAEALATAHAVGVVHGGVKPTNILLTGAPGYGPVAWPRLADCRVAHHAGPASDVYALGGVLHELLTGAHPHRVQTQVRVLYRRAEPAEARELRLLVEDCLLAQPAGRPSAETLAQHLSALARSMAGDITPPARRTPEARRSTGTLPRYWRCRT